MHTRAMAGWGLALVVGFAVWMAAGTAWAAPPADSSRPSEIGQHKRGAGSEASRRKRPRRRAAGQPRTRKRRKARRSKRTAWKKMQFSGGLALAEQGTSEGVLPVSAFAGMPLTAYRPGNFVSGGARGAWYGCGEGCQFMGAGPALRLGVAKGRRRQKAPSYMLFVEAGLIFGQYDLDRERSPLFQSGQNLEGNTMYPRLSLGFTSVAFRNEIWRRISRPRHGYDLLCVFLLPFNHAEVFVDLNDPPGSDAGMRAGLMVGMGM